MSEKEIWECLDEAILNMVQREDLSEKGLYLPADTDDPYTHTHTQPQHFSLHYLRCFICGIITDGWGNNFNKVLIQLHNEKKKTLILYLNE